MIRDTFFSMSRFIHICRRDMVENWKSNVLRIVLLYGVTALVLVWNGYFEYSREIYRDWDPANSFVQGFFIWGVFAFGCLSASFTMEKMKTKTSRISVLMLPATPFEKYFSRWLVSTVGFLVVFLITYALADYTRVLINSIKYPDIKVIVPFSFSDFMHHDNGHYAMFNNLGEVFRLIAFYFFCQSSFILGSSIWPKNAFLKTFATGVVIVIVYSLVISGLRDLFTNHDIVYELMFGDFKVLASIIAILLACFNWIMAYYRFKEAEIINRM